MKAKAKQYTSRLTPVNPGPSAADLAMEWPTGTLPVNETKSTRGCWTAKEVKEGDMWMTCMTPFGTPACTRARANLSAVKGVCGDGLSKTALPAMIAGRTELIETR